jgi:large subunit ribosomal protein L17
MKNVTWQVTDGCRFVDRPNELRESKPPCPPPPPRIPLPPWLQSRHARQWAPMSSGL